MEIRSFGKWTLTESNDYTSMSGMHNRVKGERGVRTDWTGLKHEFPDERVRAPFVEVTLC